MTQKAMGGPKINGSNRTDGIRRRRWTVIVLGASMILLLEARTFKKLFLGSSMVDSDKVDLTGGETNSLRQFPASPRSKTHRHSATRYNEVLRKNLKTKRPKRTPAPDTPLVPTPHISDLTFQLPPKERLITLVHVGKAGGMTTRSATSLMCRLNRKKYNTPFKMEKCVDRFLPEGNVLARSVRYYFHMYSVNETQLAASTSFLVMLRNPVDRVVSNYRYSHPLNCNQEKWAKRVAVRPWGCEAREHIQQRQSVPDIRLYQQCFPSAGMEDLAQSAMGPWDNLTPTHFRNFSLAQQQNCRWVARQLIQGKYFTSPSPHMRYNYEYYSNWTLEAHPDKEVLGIRTTHEWEDMKALDVAMGGNAVFRREGRQVSHGSEFYEPSPLSDQAYQKLCCVLWKEMQFYDTFLLGVINLNTAQKEACREDVRSKCGITENWQDWKSKCKQQLARDRKKLLPLSNVGNNDFLVGLTPNAIKAPPVRQRDETK